MAQRTGTPFSAPRPLAALAPPAECRVPEVRLVCEKSDLAARISERVLLYVILIVGGLVATALFGTCVAACCGLACGAARHDAYLLPQLDGPAAKAAAQGGDAPGKLADSGAKGAGNARAVTGQLTTDRPGLIAQKQSVGRSQIQRVAEPELRKNTGVAEVGGPAAGGLGEAGDEVRV